MARAQRRDGGSHFKHYTYDSSLSSDENLINLSEFIETLIGEDDWCGQDIEDKNVVDLTDDEILREIDCNEDNSIEKILDRWRKSVSRQEDSFSRRGDSERNKRQISQNSRELKDAASKTQKITSFYSSTTSSVHSSNRNSVEVIEETMDDIMLDNQLGDDDENEDNDNISKPN